MMARTCLVHGLALGKREKTNKRTWKNVKWSNGRAGGTQIAPTHNDKRELVDRDQCCPQNPVKAEQHKLQEIESLRQKAGYALDGADAER
jgi:hypothetical protein